MSVIHNASSEVWLTLTCWKTNDSEVQASLRVQGVRAGEQHPMDATKNLSFCHQTASSSADIRRLNGLDLWWTHSMRSSAAHLSGGLHKRMPQECNWIMWTWWSLLVTVSHSFWMRSIDCTFFSLSLTSYRHVIMPSLSHICWSPLPPRH